MYPSLHLSHLCDFARLSWLNRVQGALGWCSQNVVRRYLCITDAEVPTTHWPLTIFLFYHSRLWHRLQTFADAQGVPMRVCLSPTRERSCRSHDTTAQTLLPLRRFTILYPQPRYRLFVLLSFYCHGLSFILFLISYFYRLLWGFLKLLFNWKIGRLILENLQLPLQCLVLA